MKKRLDIEGMSCMHCVKHVEEALRDVAGVINVTVDLKEKNAVVELYGDVQDSQLTEVIEEVGYDVTGITKL
jgi:copper chaperone